MSYVFTFTAQRNALHAPHLYDVFMDGVDDYILIEPFIVYGWSEITIAEWIYAFNPKTNSLNSRFSMIGDRWTDHPSTFHETNNLTSYTSLSVFWRARRPDGTAAGVVNSWLADVNRWVHMVRRFTATRAYGVWVNGVNRYNATVPADQMTVLEWNPDTATFPELYRRFVLGNSSRLIDFMNCMYGEVCIYSRALSPAEISSIYNNHVMDASGLALFIDPTFFDGTRYVDLSGNSRHGIPFGTTRLESINKWIWTITNRYNDNMTHVLIPANVHFVIESPGGIIVMSGRTDSIVEARLPYDGPLKLIIHDYQFANRTPARVMTPVRVRSPSRLISSVRTI